MESTISNGDTNKRPPLRPALSIHECEDDMRNGTKVIKVSFQENGRKKISKKTLLLDEDKTSIRYQPTAKGPTFKIPIAVITNIVYGENLEQKDCLKPHSREHQFVINYKFEEKPARKLGFVTFSSNEASTWIQGLQHLLSRKDETEEDPLLNYPWLDEAFTKADKDANGGLGFDETINVMRELNMGFDVADVTDRFQRFNVEGNTTMKRGKLTKKEFAEFFQDFHYHPTLQRLLEKYSDCSEYMDFQSFKRFMETEQKTTLSDEEALEILHEFNDGSLAQLPYEAFQRMLLSPTNSLFKRDQNKICHDMTQPMSHYFINTSHNTYLSADQWKGPSSVEAYINALEKGCRCVELDCWNGDDDEPVIYHGHTLTSKILFKDVIEAINKHAFSYSEYPLILSFENHCSPKQQEKMAFYLKDIIGDKLYIDPVNSELTALPSPEELKGKILCKGKKLPLNIEEMGDMDEDSNSYCVSDEDESEDAFEVIIEDPELAAKYDITRQGILESDSVNGEVNGSSTPKALSLSRKLVDTIDRTTKRKKRAQKLSPIFSKLVNYIQSVHYCGLQEALDEQDYFKMSSFGEAKFTKLAKSEPQLFNKFNRKFLTRTYPAGKRVDSSNYNPLLAWVVGCQLAAMNFQTDGTMMDLNNAMFQLNGGCGYVLKPKFMLEDEFKYDAEKAEENEGIDSVYIQLLIISGHLFPKNSTSIVDPYVSLSIYGVKDDTIIGKLKTKTIKDNGFNPLWNEAFQFRLNVPELAFLRFVVYDDVVGRDDVIGQCTIPYAAVNTGYRSIKLLDKSGNELPYASLLVHLEERPITITS